ncbi:MAG: hypothetical protein PHW27_12790 [Melioribacteraceae bacterium]|nr:hypothetical protein [Melioribacteraceae bacterium]
MNEKKNNVENDKATTVSFYVMLGSLGVGFLALLVYVLSLLF